MRVKFGIASVVGFGLSVTVALGQGAGQRGAKLLAPRAADAEEGRVQVRAAAEPLPEFPTSTPVTPPRTGKGPVVSYQPGYDAGVRTAGTTATEKPPRSAATKDEASFMSRGFDKIKGAFTSAPPAAAAATPGPGAEAANPNAPFRGTSPTGQPVYAGPPAYRWYGWGSVTPGANPYAPTGQSPRASANWFSITGATPGAFPTQVTDPYRLGGNPGTEPPAYVSPPAPPAAPSTIYVQPYRSPLPQPGPIVPRASSVPSGTGNGLTPPLPETYSTPTPTLMPIPSVGAALPVVPAAQGPATPTVPVSTAPLTPLAVAEPEPTGPRVLATQPLVLAPMVRVGEPSLAAIPTVSPLPVMTGGAPVVVVPAPVGDVKPPAPAPLPISVTTDEPKWQSTPTVPAPAPINWNPAGDKR